MNWDAISAIGEIVGAAAVVISLVYLAVQIRSSAKVSRQTAAHSILDAHNEALSLLSGSGELAAIWRTGLADVKELSPDELVRFYSFCRQILIHFEEMYQLALKGELESWTDAYMTVTLQELLRTPGLQEYLRLRGHWYSAEFQAYMETTMKAPDPEGPPLTEQYR